MIKSLAAAASAMALAVAPAQAACWNADETSAATVRELQSMLMVAALRCHVAQHDFLPDYNAFLLANKYTIQQMNDRLKAHFIKAGGPVKGQAAYDAFTTSLANGHGAEGASTDICQGMGSLAKEAALVAGSTEGLLLLAARQGVTVALPEGVCGAPGLTIASSTPSTAIATAAITPAAPSSSAMASAAPTTAALASPQPSAAPVSGPAAVTPVALVTPAPVAPPQ